MKQGLKRAKEQASAIKARACYLEFKTNIPDIKALREDIERFEVIITDLIEEYNGITPEELATYNKMRIFFATGHHLKAQEELHLLILGIFDSLPSNK